jgi:hypothetical protein
MSNVRRHTHTMGYHLTILRTSSGGQIPIGLAEAKKAASGLGEWTFTESPPTFELKRENGSCTLWYQEGEFWAKTPEPWEIGKMIALADKLGARVRGDEYETYSSSESSYVHPDDAALRKVDEAKSLAMLRRDPLGPYWMRVYIISFFVVLGLAAYLVGKWFERQ